MQQDLRLPRRQGVLAKASPGHARAQRRCTCRAAPSWAARASPHRVRREPILDARFAVRISAYEHPGESR